MSENSDRQTGYMRLTNQLLGLIVFIAGIVLIIVVFNRALALYEEVNADTFAVTPSVEAVDAPGADEPVAPSPDSVAAQPAQGSVVQPLLVLVARIVILLALGWLAALMASRGAGIATGAGTKQ